MVGLAKMIGNVYHKHVSTVFAKAYQRVSIVTSMLIVMLNCIVRGRLIGPLFTLAKS